MIFICMFCFQDYWSEEVVAELKKARAETVKVVEEDRDAAQKFAELVGAHQSPPALMYDVMLAFLKARDRPNAKKWFEKALSKGHFLPAYMAGNTYVKTLFGDSEFDSLFQKSQNLRKAHQVAYAELFLREFESQKTLDELKQDLERIESQAFLWGVGQLELVKTENLLRQIQSQSRNKIDFDATLEKLKLVVGAINFDLNWGAKAGLFVSLLKEAGPKHEHRDAFLYWAGLSRWGKDMPVDAKGLQSTLPKTKTFFEQISPDSPYQSAIQAWQLRWEASAKGLSSQVEKRILGFVNSHRDDGRALQILASFIPTIVKAKTDFSGQLKFLDGTNATLESLKGSFVLLDFWATWCAPCIEEFPHIKNAKDSFGKNLKIISVSLDDAKMSLPKLKKEVNRHNMTWTVAFSGDGFSDELARQFFVDQTGIPSLFLLDPKGKVVASGEELRGDKLKSTLKKWVNL